jgi:uncharacterized membrane protein
METRVHELHPTLIHAPLALLPSTVVVDLAATFTRDRKLEKAGRTMWWSVAASGLLAGLAGMAASQEVKADKHARDMMFLHGLGNVVLVMGAFGVAAWRASHRPGWFSNMLGLGAFAFASYTGWLGGEMVYSHGVGVKDFTLKGEALELLSPRLASREAPARLLRDAVKGLGWLLGRASQVFSGRERLDPGAFGMKDLEEKLVSPAPVEQGASHPESHPV